MKFISNEIKYSELSPLLQLLTEKRLFLADLKLNPREDCFDVTSITVKNLSLEDISDNEIIEIINKKIDIEYKNAAEILRKLTKEKLVPFALFYCFRVIDLSKKSVIFSTLVNTNFIFKIEKLNIEKIDEINAINTRTKLRDRIISIESNGGVFKYMGAEKDTMTYNLKMVDSLMPEIIAYILYAFYKYKISSISKIVDFIHEQNVLNQQINYGDKAVLINKVQKLLVDVLLGFFAGSKWDGNYEANGSIVLKNTGDCVAFHIIELATLRTYLYENIKLDTPSTTRHRFGKLYLEKNNKLYFKLNLQLRF
ncbi:MAG: HpaII family restriction endonuclease [Methylococcales bacterium]